MVDLSELRSGFCDRLRLATWGIALALHRGETRLVLKDERSRYCPYLFSDICAVEGLEIVPWQESFGPCWRSGIGVNTFPGNPRHAAQLMPPDVGLSARAFQRLWLQAYARLQPRDAIHLAVQSLALGMDCLGLHLRYTDKIRQVARGWMEVQVGQIPLLQATTLRLIQRTGYRQVFVACDEARQKQLWCDLLRDAGYTVIEHSASYDESLLRQTGAHDFGVDLFALAACGQVLGTSRSGVVHTVDWMNGRSRSWFAVDALFWPMLLRRLGQLFSGAVR